jgi:hypothetical protein
LFHVVSHVHNRLFCFCGQCHIWLNLRMQRLHHFNTLLFRGGARLRTVWTEPLLCCVSLLWQYLELRDELGLLSRSQVLYCCFVEKLLIVIFRWFVRNLHNCRLLLRCGVRGLALDPFTVFFSGQDLGAWITFESGLQRDSRVQLLVRRLVKRTSRTLVDVSADLHVFGLLLLLVVTLCLQLVDHLHEVTVSWLAWFQTALRWHLTCVLSVCFESARVSTVWARVFVEVSHRDRLPNLLAIGMIQCRRSVISSVSCIIRALHLHLPNTRAI